MKPFTRLISVALLLNITVCGQLKVLAAENPHRFNLKCEVIKNTTSSILISGLPEITNSSEEKSVEIFHIDLDKKIYVQEPSPDVSDLKVTSSDLIFEDIEGKPGSALQRVWKEVGRNTGEYRYLIVTDLYKTEGKGRCTLEKYTGISKTKF